MAIMEMQKFRLMILHEHQATLMRQLQDFQQVELIPTTNEEKELTSFFQQMAADPAEEQLERKVDQLAWARQFLEAHLSSMKRIEILRQPIRHYTLQELKQITDQFDWETLYMQLRQADKRLRMIEQERRELSAQEQELTFWRHFEEHPKIFDTFKQSVGVLATVPNTELANLSQKLDHISYTYLETIYQTNQLTYLYLLYHKESQTKVAQAMRATGCEEYLYTFEEKPSIEVTHLQKREQALAKEEQTLKTKLRGMREAYQQFGIVAEYFDALRVRLSSRPLFLETDHACVLSGWVPREYHEELVKRIARSTKGEYYLEFQEVTEEELEEVPILLKNHPLVAPFEGLVNMYSLPKYDELDPTPFMAPFYAIAFGMMVADAGYGLLLFLATFLGKRLFHFKEGMQQNLTFFEICAFPTIAWGLIYGNFFGYELPFHVLSSSQDITEILIVAVVFGYLQIVFALCLKFYVLWKMKQQKLKAFFQAGSWLFFLASAVLVASGWLLFPESNLKDLGIMGIILSLVMVVFGGSLDGETLLGRIGTGLYSLMDVTSYLGDLVSYTRLMALGVAGGSIAAAFNLIIGYLPTMARFTIGIVLFLALHGINLFLSFLGAYVHGIRLQYLEFFGKFFTGGGRAFRPFKSQEHFVKVVSKEQQGED